MTKRTIAVWILVTVLLVPFTQAKIPLGSVQDGKSAVVFQGDSVGFRILFFNIHEESALNLELDVKHPEGWSVVLAPLELDLEYTEPGFQEREEGYEYISTSSGIVRAKAVNIMVNVPEFAEEGDYTVKVSAKTGKQGGILSTYQVRNFYFKIDVRSRDIEISSDTGEDIVKAGEESKPEEEMEDAAEKPIDLPDNETKEEEAIESDFKDVLDGITGMVTGNPNLSILLLIGVLALVIILRLFKKI